jgi:hypothetical protein
LAVKWSVELRRGVGFLSLEWTRVNGNGLGWAAACWVVN